MRQDTPVNEQVSHAERLNSKIKKKSALDKDEFTVLLRHHWVYSTFFRHAIMVIRKAGCSHSSQELGQKTTPDQVTDHVFQIPHIVTDSHDLTPESELEDIDSPHRRLYAGQQECGVSRQT